VFESMKIADYQKQIIREVDLAFEQFLEAMPDLSPPSQAVVEQVKIYCQATGGKRVRGSIAAIAADQNGVEQKTAIRLGVVMELTHNYLLIVDDVMDRSTTRRGQATIHEGLRLSGQYDSFESEMLAIDAGLILQHLAMWYMARIELPENRMTKINQVFHRLIATTGFGQFDDIVQRTSRPPKHESDIIRKYQQKSGYYTFVNPIICGLIASGKDDDKSTKQAEKFGLAAGVVFQLHNDYIELFDDKHYGKAKADDIRDGVYTLLVHDLMTHSNAQKRQELNAIIGNPQANDEQIQLVRQSMIEAGTKKRVAMTLNNYLEQALVAADEGSGFWGQELTNYLQDLLMQCKINETSA